MQRGWWAALALALAACGGSERGSVQLMSQDDCTGRADRVLCSAGQALTCQSGKIASQVACDAPLSCVDGVGCRRCNPGAPACEGNTRLRCNQDGSALESVEECAAGLSCSMGGCLDLCAEAAANRSYLGCDYWPVFTSNKLLDPSFVPAVAIGNGNLVAAHIVLTKDQTTVAELDVAAGSAQTVLLAFDTALKNADGSLLVRQGAYHLRASVPVTVHQYNPLLYELPVKCSPTTGTDQQTEAGVCNSFSNDASLLFPSEALQRDPKAQAGPALQFVALSRAAFMGQRVGAPDFGGRPGFVAVVAVGDAPTSVTVTSSAFTAPSPSSEQGPGPDAVEALEPGASLQRTLSPGDVLQIVSAVPSLCTSAVSNLGDVNFCDPGAQYDLTGTHISADGPIQVISGHDCTNVPFDRPACDHLEESMLPLHAWGNNAVVTVPRAAAGGEYVLRLLSGEDANTITFDPPVHDPITLARDQLLELRTRVSTVVQGSGRLMVGQYLVGEGTSTMQVGDPSLSISVPVEQYRTSYNFISPSTYQRSYVDIIALVSDVVSLDGQLISTFTPIGTSGFSTASVVLQTAGAHEIHGVGERGIGIVLYGIAPFTSYMLPGGLDLAPLSDIGI